MIDSRFYDLAEPFYLDQLLLGLDVQLPDNKADIKRLIVEPSDLAVAKSGQISFLSNKRLKGFLETSEASACLVTERLASSVEKQNILPIISKAPRAHFARIVAKMVSRKLLGGQASYQKSSSAKVHQSAVIGANVVVADDVYIGPNTVIGPGVSIGPRTVIEGLTNIDCAIIGEDCHIKSGAQIGGAGFGMDADEHGFINLPHIGRVIIKDRVFIGSQTCVDRGFLGDTELHNDVKIDNLVQIAHNCKIGSGTMIAGHTGISGSCTIGKNVRMGGAVGLADHLTIGDGVQIAASSGVMNDIPDGEYWGGTPATPALEQARILAATRRLIQKKKT